jgi:outer membrane lipoprotein-sorting protein
MRYLILLIGLGIFVGGCSQKNDNPKPSQKTLSGIYEFADENHPEYYMRYDFRTDGKVIYKAQALKRFSDRDDAIEKINMDGKGIYKIDKDRVTVLLANSLQFSYLTFVDTNPPVLQANLEFFRIDGDDLIHLSGTVDGGATNIDSNETRFIKKR